MGEHQLLFTELSMNKMPNPVLQRPPEAAAAEPRRWAARHWRNSHGTRF